MLRFVRAADLAIDELIQFDEDAGLFRFVGQRAVIVDVVALGLLRKHLVDTIGMRAARAVLTRFGFVHGWRFSELIRDGFTWDSDEERVRALARVMLLRGEARGTGDTDLYGARGLGVLDSYEAEQHVLQFGRAKDPVCWSMAGLVSGIASKVMGHDYFVLEDQCVACGDAACRFYGRTREGWGESRREDLSYFTQERLGELLDGQLHGVTSALRKVEHAKPSRVHGRAFDPETRGIVTQSTAMRGVVDLAVRAARVDSTVLITGESGVGKEHIARLIHDQSARSNGPLLAINCGAIAETLLESELFGHARGAFTGASTDRIGLFESARGGTIFLDEIGETTPGMQTKLLRTLQERVVRRVGENHDRSFDVRVVAATNRDLATEVAAGRFRHDLLYRLKVIEIKVPPLRDRRDDVLPLARLLFREAATRLGRNVTTMSARVADQLMRYAWPGNVRELANAMEHAVALAQGKTIEADDLPEEIRTAVPRPEAVSVVRPLDEVERDYILAALERNAGNQTHTAKQLGIGSATLYRKLKSYEHKARRKR
jgi:DNA-binding NtrC family response regulator